MPTDSAREIQIREAHQESKAMPVDSVGRLQRTGDVMRPPRGLELTPRALDLLTNAIVYTPERIKSMLRTGEAGQLGMQLEMFVKMIDLDAHLGGIVETRCRVIEQAEFSIVPPEGLEEDQRALDAVAYCKAVIGAIPDFRSKMALLNRGAVLGFQGLEIEWEDTIPIALHQPPERDWEWRSGTGLMVRTVDDGWKLAGPDKYVINAPLGFSTNIARRGIMRRVAMPWVLKQYAVMDWAIFVEIYGVNPRVAKYPGAWDADDAKIQKLHDLVVAMRASGVITLPKEVDLEALSSGGGGGKGAWSPHETYIEWSDRQQSKAVLGQTLTTDTSGSTGTFAAAKTHDEVRIDIAQADGVNIGMVGRRDFLAPTVYYGLGPDYPVPMLLIEIRDREEEKAAAEKLSVAVNDLGLEVPVSAAYSQLRIEQPERDKSGKLSEAILPGKKSAPSPFAEMPPDDVEDEDDEEQGQDAQAASHGHRHALSARDAVADEVQLTNDVLADLSPEQWEKAIPQLVVEDVREMLARNPELTPEEALTRVAGGLWGTVDLDPMTEDILAVLAAADMNGRAELDHEAGNIRPEEN